MNQNLNEKLNGMALAIAILAGGWVFIQTLAASFENPLKAPALVLIISLLIYVYTNTNKNA